MSMFSGKVQRSQSLTQLPSTTSTAPTTSSSKTETSKSTLDIKSTTMVKDSSTSTPIQSETQQVQSSIMSTDSSDVRGRGQRLQLPQRSGGDKKLFKAPSSSKGFLDNLKNFFRWHPTSKDKSMLQTAKGFFTGINYTSRISTYEAEITQEMSKLSSELGRPVSHSEAEESLKSKYDESYIQGLKKSKTFDSELILQHLLVMDRNPTASAQSKEDAALYAAYAEKEFAAENTHFLKETLSLVDIGRKDGAESQTMRDKMKFLFSHYIRVGSREEINVSSPIRYESQAAYEHLLLAEAYKTAVDSNDTELANQIKDKLLTIRIEKDPQAVQLRIDIKKLEYELTKVDDPNQQRDIQLQLSAKKHDLKEIETGLELGTPEQEIEIAQTRLGASIQDCTTEIYKLSKDTLSNFKTHYDKFKSGVHSTKQGRIWNEFKTAHKKWWNNRHDWGKSGISGVKQDFSNFFKSWGKFNKAVLNVYFFNTMTESDGISKFAKEAKVGMKKHQQWERGFIDGEARKRPEDYQDTFTRDLQRLLR